MIYPVLFPMQGEEHHHDIERIGIENGRCIKKQSSLENIPCIGEIIPVFNIILQSGYLVNKVNQQQVP